MMMSRFSASSRISCSARALASAACLRRSSSAASLFSSAFFSAATAMLARASTTVSLIACLALTASSLSRASSSSMRLASALSCRPTSRFSSTCRCRAAIARSCALPISWRLRSTLASLAASSSCSMRCCQALNSLASRSSLSNLRSMSASSACFLRYSASSLRIAAAFSLTCAWGGAGTGRALGPEKLSSRARSASISVRIASMCVGRSRTRSLKGAALASFSSAALRLASFAACIAISSFVGPSRSLGGGLGLIGGGGGSSTGRGRGRGCDSWNGSCCVVRPRPLLAEPAPMLALPLVLGPAPDSSVFLRVRYTFSSKESSRADISGAQLTRREMVSSTNSLSYSLSQSSRTASLRYASLKR
mmetsp:Transcript_39733/g.88290  ORF Transcript_39733/g.88290 Transcript_39733/m.88290 type:complete len:364 (+) Transcript_39733:1506-2597(+)